MYGLSIDDVRIRFPEVYQHLLMTVKPERDTNNRDKYRANWWIFGEARADFRPALTGLNRYIATIETAKHRFFLFMSAEIMSDHQLDTFALEDGYYLGVLSSIIHVKWSLSTGGLLEDRPVYVKTRCFDPFPFPAADDLQKARIRRIAEELDAHRQSVLAEHPHLTLTGLYNVLEKLRAGTAPEALPAADHRIFTDGLVLILKELHERLDAAVAAAYGWPENLPEQETLARLVALNRERAAEEAADHIRWLRPEYQIPRFGSASDKLDLRGGKSAATPIAATAAAKPAFPTDEVAQAAAILSALFTTPAATTPDALAATFRGGRRNLPRIEATLAALTRLGHLSTQDGIRFTLRRTA